MVLLLLNKNLSQYLNTTIFVDITDIWSLVVGRLGIRAARALDDKIGCIVSTSNTLLHRLALDQLGQETYT